VPKILSKINLPQYAAAPGSPAQGDMYYNTVDDTVYVYDGTSWLDLAAGGGGTGDITAVVAGDGLTGGATVGSATLDVGAGTGISVSSDAVAIDTSVVPVKTDNLSVFATSTSAAIGIGSVELGHATDTTITRSGAGTVAVEGVDLVNTNDARLTDSRTPTAHAASHKSAGSDAIKLNELAAPDADVSLNSNKITNLATPTSNADAATKAYVDAVAEGLDVKDSCRIATTVDHGLSGLVAIDGVTPIAGDRILVKNQNTASQNGIYVADSSSWSRASDAAQDGEITPGTFVFVEEGSTQADSGWVVTTNGTITIGATAIVWTQFSGAGQIVAGTGITKSGNTISVNTTTVPLKTDNLSVFAATTSSQLRGVISDETGTGSLVFATEASLSDPTIAGATLTGNPVVSAGTELRFYRSDNAQYVGIQASASTGGAWTLTLPTSNGNADQFLQTDGSGVTTWASVTGATVYYQAAQPTGGTYAAGDMWIDSDDNTTPNTNNLLIAQKTASYTLATDLSDAPDEVIEMNVATANTVSIPTDATANYPIGTQIHVFQFGAGQTTIQAVTPVTTTVVGAPGVKLRAQYSFATIIKRAANYWVVVGDTAA